VDETKGRREVGMSGADDQGGRSGEAGFEALLRKGLRFDCPVCHCDRFNAVFYHLHDGKTVKASFYRCAGCDFGFTNPEMFFKPLAGRQ
jgi:hypothetical protein